MNFNTLPVLPLITNSNSNINSSWIGRSVGHRLDQQPSWLIQGSDYDLLIVLNDRLEEYKKCLYFNLVKMLLVNTRSIIDVSTASKACQHKIIAIYERFG